MMTLRRALYVTARFGPKYVDQPTLRRALDINEHLDTVWIAPVMAGLDMNHSAAKHWAGDPQGALTDLVQSDDPAALGRLRSAAALASVDYSLAVLQFGSFSYQPMWKILNDLTKNMGWRERYVARNNYLRGLAHGRTEFILPLARRMRRDRVKCQPGHIAKILTSPRDTTMTLVGRLDFD